MEMSGENPARHFRKLRREKKLGRRKGASCAPFPGRGVPLVAPEGLAVLAVSSP
jgi:hypothetical protein